MQFRTAADGAGAGFSQAMAARYRHRISNERLAAIFGLCAEMAVWDHRATEITEEAIQVNYILNSLFQVATFTTEFTENAEIRLFFLFFYSVLSVYSVANVVVRRCRCYNKISR